MAEQEELKLIVSMSDQASAGLAQLRAEFTKTAEEAKKMQATMSGGGAGKGGSGFFGFDPRQFDEFFKYQEKVKSQLGGGEHALAITRGQRGFAGLFETIKPLTKEFTNIGGSLGSMGGVLSRVFGMMGPVGTGLSAIAAHYGTAALQARSFTNQMMEFDRAIKRTGLATSYVSLSDQLRKGGFSPEGAGALLDGMAEKMGEFSRNYNNFLHETVKGLKPEQQEKMRQLMAEMLPLANDKNVEEYLNKAKENADKIEQFAIESGLGTVRAAQARTDYLKRLSLEALQYLPKDFKFVKPTAADIALQERQLRLAREFDTVFSSISVHVSSIFRNWNSTFIGLPTVLRTLDTLLGKIDEILKKRALIDEGKMEPEARTTDLSGKPYRPGSWAARAAEVQRKKALDAWRLEHGIPLDAPPGTLAPPPGTPKPEPVLPPWARPPGTPGFQPLPKPSRGSLAPPELTPEAEKGMTSLQGKILEWGVWGAFEAGKHLLPGLAGTISGLGAGALNTSTVVFMKKWQQDIIDDAKKTGGITPGSTGDMWGGISWMMEQAKKTRQDFGPEEQGQQRPSFKSMYGRDPTAGATFDERFGGAQQAGTLGHLRSLTGMANADRFSSAVNKWQASTNIDDRRGQPQMPWMTQAKVFIKDTVTEVGRDLGFERFRAKIVPAGPEAGSALARQAGAFDIVLKEDIEQTAELTKEIKRLNDGLFLFDEGGGEGEGGAGAGGRRRSRFGVGGSGGTGTGTGAYAAGPMTGMGSGPGGPAQGPYTGTTPQLGEPGAPKSAQGAALYQKLLTKFQANPPKGLPPDAARFGITKGTPEEWARFGVSVAHAESGFNPNSKNLNDPGGSFGIFQYAHNQVPGGNAHDIDASVDAFVRDANAASVDPKGLRGSQVLGKRFSTIGSHPERGAAYLPQVSTGAPTTGGPGTPGAPGAGTGGTSKEQGGPGSYTTAMEYLRSRGGHDARSSDQPGGLTPQMASALAQAGQAYESATGRKANFGEMFRDRARQAQYYARYRSGAGGLAAPPGMSRHERGTATDVPRGGFRDWLAAGHAGQYGLEFLKGGAYAKDPVHVQLAGQGGAQAPVGGGAGTGGEGGSGAAPGGMGGMGGMPGFPGMGGMGGMMGGGSPLGMLSQFLPGPLKGILPMLMGGMGGMGGKGGGIFGMLASLFGGMMGGAPGGAPTGGAPSGDVPLPRARPSAVPMPRARPIPMPRSRPGVPLPRSRPGDDGHGVGGGDETPDISVWDDTQEGHGIGGGDEDISVWRGADLDRAQGGVMRHAVHGTGKLTVDVNAPAGTKVGAEGGGIFKEVETNRYMQMPQSGTGGSYLV